MSDEPDKTMLNIASHETSPIRPYTWGGSTKCSRCPAERAKGSRYCRTCRALYMREWRKTRITIRKAERIEP